MIRTRALLTFVASLLLALPVAALQPPPAGEYVPAVPGTATENLPAAPFVAAAYAFVWIAAMIYLWSVWRRLNKVEADMQALERKSRTAR
jgi:hypothetical protein